MSIQKILITSSSIHSFWWSPSSIRKKKWWKEVKLRYEWRMALDFLVCGIKNGNGRWDSFEKMGLYGVSLHSVLPILSMFYLDSQSALVTPAFQVWCHDEMSLCPCCQHSHTLQSVLFKLCFMDEQVNRKQRNMDWEIRMYKTQNTWSNYMIKENK